MYEGVKAFIKFMNYVICSIVQHLNAALITM